MLGNASVDHNFSCRHLVPLQEDLLGGGDQEAAAIQLIETGRQVEGHQGDEEETEKILSKSDPQEATVPLTETVQSD